MSAGMGPEATERAQSEQEHRDDIESGEVWPEWCEECHVETHAWPTCPKNPDRIR